MEKFKGNKLTFKTYAHLKVNDTEIEIPALEKTAFPMKSDNKRALREFENIRYAVSDEIVKINENYGNLYKYYEAKSGKEKDFEIVEIVVNDENRELFDTQNIIAHKNSKLRIILDYKGEGESEKLRNSIIRIVANENSKIDLFIVNRDDNNTTTLESVAIFAKENSKVRICQYEFGSKKLYMNFQANLVGENADVKADSVYFGSGEQELNMIYNIFHHGKESKSDVMVNGALKDNAYKNFKSNLDFKEGSRKSQGSEEEYTILLDDSVTAISVPLLLCHEDDVEGNHAASAGKLDQEQLFYIMSRGFSEEEAAAIIIESKFSSSIDRLENEELEAEIWDILHKTVKF